MKKMIASWLLGIIGVLLIAAEGLYRVLTGESSQKREIK